MSDIFHEVDEDLRHEQFRKLWERFGGLILVVAFLIVAGVGGWRGYQWWQTRKANEAGARFGAAVALIEAGKPAEAQAALDKLIGEGPAGYRTLAEMRKAEVLAASDRDGAVKAYDRIVADASLSQDERDLAALRAGLLLVDSASYDDILNRLNEASQEGRAFRFSVREILAVSAWRAGNAAAARQWIEALTNDAQTPPGPRSRAEALRALLPPAAKS